MFNFLYRIALMIYGLAYLPHLIARAKQEPDQKRFFRERMGRFTHDFSAASWIWIHAVSVGEVMALRKFLNEFRIRYSNQHILLSTTTPTGQKIAQSMKNDKIHVVYFPLDFRSMMERALKTVQPCCVVLMETEIWPHLIDLANRRNIPIGIMNGRISERAFKKYSWIRSWMRPVCAKLSFCLVRGEDDQKRFETLGVLPERIRITGNMKYDVDSENDSKEAEELKKKFRRDHHLVMVGGSTHDGEETVLLKTFLKLRASFPKLKLILAPRHPERAKDVLQLAQNLGFKTIFFGQDNFEEADVLVVDVVGRMPQFYAIADLIFIGGSLIPHGGQNPIEPAREKKPILYGPYVHNFKQVFERLRESGGAVMVSRPDELYQLALPLLSDRSKREAMGLNAYKTVNELKGATDRNLQALEPFLRRIEKFEVVHDC